MNSFLETRIKLIQFALTLQGLKEESFLPNEKQAPGGTNRTIIGKWFGLNGVPWCAEAYSYIFYKGADITLLNGGWPKGYASVPQFYYNHVDKITKSPMPGDAVIYDWNRDGKMDHIGMFICWIDKDAGIFLAAEGNTTWQGDQSNGGEFLIRDRNISCVAVFISVDGILNSPHV